MMKERRDMEYRAKAFVHYYFSLFETRRSSPEALLSLFARGDFEIKAPGLLVKNQREAADRIIPFTRDARHAHEVIDIQVTIISHEVCHVAVRQIYASEGAQGELQARARYDMELVEQGRVLPSLRRSRISDIEPLDSRALTPTRARNLGSFLVYYWLSLENEHSRDVEKYESILAPKFSLRNGEENLTDRRELRDYLNGRTFTESFRRTETIFTDDAGDGIRIAWRESAYNGRAIREHEWQAMDRGANFPGIVRMT